MLLDGLHIPLSTPFHPDGRLNLPKLAANVTRYSHSPAAGFVVLGPSSEPTLISDDETREVLRTVAASAAPQKVLVAGISRDSVYSTLALAKFAAELNYDAVLIGPPAVAASVTELLTYFHTIADASTLPIILLNIAPDLAADFASHANIIGLLDTQPTDAPAIQQLLERTSAAKRQVTVTSIFAAVTRRMQIAAGATPLLSAASLSGTAQAVAAPPVSSLHHPHHVRRGRGQARVVCRMQIVDDCPWKRVLEIWPVAMPGLTDATIVAVALSNRYEAVATFDRKLAAKLKDLGLAPYF